MSDTPFVQSGDYRVLLDGDPGPFRVKLTAETPEPGLHLIHLELKADNPAVPGPLKLAWSQAAIDIQSAWHPGCDTKRALTYHRGMIVHSTATTQAPVISLHNIANTNRHTFACSDALNPVEARVTVCEYTIAFLCSFAFFTTPTPPLESYQATLRLDQRAVPWQQSLAGVQAWWETFPGLTPSPVPDLALQPMYSTWYSFHQKMSDKTVEDQCRIAKTYGCEAVIIDDGWQTEDNSGGYAYCGEWEAAPGKFPDFAAHVKRLHDMGMKSLVWFSVPFIGWKSAAHAKFAGKYLYDIDYLSCSVLDPRYPEVREYLVSLYEKVVREWDIDGLKLDFVDRFVASEKNYTEKVGDIASVPEAVDRLLRETMSRLRKIKPDILVEFRQRYIGPLMRNYGNLFRANDCPSDAIANRTRTIDVRVLAGSTATHSDMITWRADEPVEIAALQFLNIVFSVPQISVMLDKIPADHQEMLRWWLAFWREHRDILMSGELDPRHPEQLYPFVLAKKDGRWIGAFYADTVAKLGPDTPTEIWLINATPGSRVVIEWTGKTGSFEVEERNVLGVTKEKRKQNIQPGIHALKVGPSGSLHLKQI